MFVKQANVNGTLRTVNGWHAPPIDLRDYNDRHPVILDIIGRQKRLKELLLKLKGDDLPKIIDYRSKAPPIRDQRDLGSCVLFAVTSLFEYHAIKQYGAYTRLSELAGYKNMRFLLGWTGDTGGYVRAGMGTAQALGLPPDKYWPYVVAEFEKQIPANVQLLGDKYRGIKYLRFDAGTNTPPECAYLTAKKYLVNGFPFAFGFYGFQSFRDDYVPMPGPKESVQWGHAVAGFGYDDTIEIRSADNSAVSKGAFICRNSWGKDSGIDGYFYLPYDYFLRRYALDMWTVIDAEWIDTGLYGF